MSFKILSVVGARPNFMKVAAICEAIKWTDSVGVQEETTILGVPCVTLRDKTERPVTLESWHERLGGAESGEDTQRIQCCIPSRGEIESISPLLGWQCRQTHHQSVAR